MTSASNPQRIVMEVKVQVVTDLPNVNVEDAFRYFDRDETKPSPVEYVSSALAVAGHKDWDIPQSEAHHPIPPNAGFQIRVEGPDKWSAAFDNPSAASGQERMVSRGHGAGDAGGDTG